MIMEFGGKNPDIDKSVFVADNASVIGDVCIGKKSSVWFGAVIRGDLSSVTVGENSNIQDNVTVHTGTKPTVIGNNVTVGHNAVVHSAQIGDNCLIGMGSVILDGAVIGKNSVIGAGAVVTSDTQIPDNSVVMGIPAKVVKSNSPISAVKTKLNADVYSKLADKYK